MTLGRGISRPAQPSSLASRSPALLSDTRPPAPSVRSHLPLWPVLATASAVDSLPHTAVRLVLGPSSLQCSLRGSLATSELSSTVYWRALRGATLGPKECSSQASACWHGVSVGLFPPRVPRGKQGTSPSALGLLRVSPPCLCPWGLNPHQGETQALLIVSCSCSLPPDPPLGISLNPRRDFSSSWRAGNRPCVNFMSSPLQGLQLNILYPESTQPLILNNEKNIPGI